MTEEHHPRNAKATRQSILDAACRQFITNGYDNAGLRAIAADAGIDPALICRYFGSKKQLFDEALHDLSNNPMDFVRGERASCGERLARGVLESSMDREYYMGWIALVLGATLSPEASALAHEHIKQKFIQPFSAWLGSDNAEEKAWLICSVLLGTVIMNNIQPACDGAQCNLARQIQALIDN